MSGRRDTDRAHARGGARDRSRPPRPRRPAGARWLLTLLVALFAFSWQSFVTQTHLHAIPDSHSTVSIGSGGASARLAPGHSSSNLPAACPICQEIAHAGAYLLPTPIAFHAPQAVVARYVAAPALAYALRPRSHAWQSRAPPHPLQA